MERDRIRKEVKEMKNHLSNPQASSLARSVVLIGRGEGLRLHRLWARGMDRIVGWSWQGWLGSARIA